VSFGRLERTRGAEPFSDINVTPLVDVMLVLVVIFIITAPLLASALRLDLPSSGAATPAKAAVAVTVVLDSSGSLMLDGRAVTPAELTQGLVQAARRNPETEVQLRADQSVHYGRVVEVMGAAQQAGLNRIGFVAEPKKP
jgi:biopolymer transport protein TolR